MSYSVYKLLHVLGFLMAFVALGGVAVHAASGGDRRSSPTRRLVSALHGAGLLLVVVAGFGMLAKLGIDQGGLFPGWVWAKLVLWLLLGAALVLPYRKPALAPHFLWLLPLLGALAGYLALYKPF